VPVVVIGIARIDGTPVYGVSTEMDGVQPEAVDANTFRVEVEFPQLCLLPGAYVVKAHPLDSEGVRLFDTIERQLTIRGNSREFGLVRLSHTWKRVATPAGTLLRCVSVV
jgi:lipopolysaccharide transport system ATP-binding protein